MLESHSEKIEKEKLKALGKKNQLAEEIESRNRKENQLKTMIREKKQELDRLKFEYDSLIKIENEQKLIIEKLMNNDDNYN